ncbi:hypothetical protein AVEN_182861-1, partial [Araneus ventricosus]
KASPFQDFVIPALDQETYGEFLHFGPGLGVSTLERFSCTEDNSWKASPFQVFVIPALEQERYGEFLPWGPGLGVFTLERFFYTEEESRVSFQSTKKESEGGLEQKISPFPTKETRAMPKIKVAAANPKLERGPKKETDAKPKLPRSLACILDSQNINYDRNFGPRRTTEVSEICSEESSEPCEEEHIVTSMESRFPAMRVLWLGREFYKVKHGVTSSTVMAP